MKNENTSTKVLGRRYNNGSAIPQHRLLSKAEWDRLRKRKIKRFSYWSTKGPIIYADGTKGFPHDKSFTVTIEDAP